MEKRTKILICLCISLALLFTIDCYYRESESPYDEINHEEHIVAELNFNDPDKLPGVVVYEFDDQKFGNYYKIYRYYRIESFRIFKEEEVEYETPVIIDEGDYYKIVIGRKGLNDLVYIISYSNYNKN